jgi:hypothetical protein
MKGRSVCVYRLWYSEERRREGERLEIYSYKKAATIARPFATFATGYASATVPIWRGERCAV